MRRKEGPLRGVEDALPYRGGELRAIDDAFAHGARVVTVRGVAGVGKTLVARGYASYIARERGERVAVLSASDVESSRVLASRIAAALGQVVDGDTSDPVLLAAPNDRPLLVIDDLPVELDGVPALIDRVASAARVLVTAREGLALFASAEIRVLPLPLPEVDADLAAVPSLDGPEVAAWPLALQLFANTVREAGRRVPPSVVELRAWTGLCRAAGGIPLALVILARAAANHSVRELDRMRERLLDVPNAKGSLEAHHASLRAAIARSFEGLKDRDRDALVCASVTRAEFDMETFVALQPNGDDADGASVQSLDELLRRSLLEVEYRDDGPVYSVATPIRLFALECARPEALERAECSLRDHVVLRAREHRDALLGEAPGAAIAALQSLEPEMVGILATASARPGDEAWRSAGAYVADAMLSVRQATVGLSSDQIAEYARTLDILAAGPSAPIASARLALARSAMQTFGAKGAMPYFEVAVTAAQSAGSEAFVRAVSSSAFAAAEVGDMEGALASLSAASERLDDCTDATLAFAFACRAEVFAIAGRSEEAIANAAQAKEVAAAARSVLGAVFAGTVHAYSLAETGALAHAVTALDALVGLARRERLARLARETAVVRAFVVLRSGDAEKAAELLATIRDESVDARAPLWVRLATLGLAVAEAALGRDEPSRRSFLSLTGLESPLESWRPFANCGYAGLAVLAALAGDVDIARQHLAAAHRQPSAVALEQLFLDGLTSIAARAAGLVEDAELAKLMTHARRQRADHWFAKLEAVAADRRKLVVSPDGLSFRAPGSAVVQRCAQGPAARIFRALVDRAERGGAPLGLDEAIAIGWPGEKVRAASARNRVHVTIARMRNGGLREVVLHDGEGYRLDPRVQIVRAEL
jgi:hypothetical protein